MVDILAGSRPIEIGRFQENEHRRLVFPVGDILHQYPDATFQVLHKRPQDDDAYPVSPNQISVENGRLFWLLSAADLSYTGDGKCEVIAYSGTVVAKSIKYTVTIDSALDGSATPPEPWQGWVVQVKEDADRAEAAAELLENPGAEAVTLEPGSEATASYSEGVFTFGIPAGVQGQQGEPGKDGKDGADGAPGADGFSPVATVSKSGNTATISVTDKSGTTTASISDGVTGEKGEKGDTGSPGADGFSPTASVSKSGAVATISITDKTGTTTASVSDGAAGAKGDKGDTGEAGYTPVRGTDYWTAADKEEILSEAEAEFSEDISDITADLSLVKDDLNAKAPVILQTASGDIVTVTDGADGMPLSAVVSVDPVQDLHGQANPYPAGGGKNLLPLMVDKIKSTNTAGTWNGNAYTLNGLTFTINADASGNVSGINVNGTASSDADFYIVSQYTFTAGSYTLTGCPSGGSTSTYRIFATNWGSDTGSGATVTLDGSTSSSIRINIKSGTSVSNQIYKPMVRLSSVSDASFAPYSNLCPISGRTGANVSRTGKNLLNIDENVMIASGWNRYFPIHVAEGTYTLSCQNDFGASSDKMGAMIYFSETADNQGYVLRIFTLYNFGDGTHSGQVTFTAEQAKRIKYIGFMMRASGTDISVYSNANIQLESGSTATAYEPYIGAIYPISWQTAAGTVYKGVLDMVTEKLTATHQIVTADGSQTLGSPSSGAYDKEYCTDRYITVSTMKSYSSSAQKPGCISSALKLKTSGIWTETAEDSWNTFNMNATQIHMNMANSVLGIETTDTRDTRTAKFSSYLTNNPISFVVELATPLVYSLTDLPTITTLKGYNAIWADTGAVAVTYPADTKLYVQKELAVSRSLMELIITANHEIGMTASKAYSSGDLLIVNGTLYKAITSIANGGTLTVGTNVTATTVASELAALA